MTVHMTECCFMACSHSDSPLPSPLPSAKPQRKPHKLHGIESQGIKTTTALFFTERCYQSKHSDIQVHAEHRYLTGQREKRFICEAEKVSLEGNTLRDKMHEEQLHLQHKVTL